MSGTVKLLTESLTRFYSVPENGDVLCLIATGKSDVSLRLVEWFVSRDRVVNADYRARLKVYTRRLFDPFKRSERILLELGDGERMFETTLGQMNFVKWMIEEKHWTRLNADKATLNEEMVAEAKARRPEKSCKSRAKACSAPEPTRPRSWKPHLLTFS